MCFQNSLIILCSDSDCATGDGDPKLLWISNIKDQCLHGLSFWSTLHFLTVLYSEKDDAVISVCMPTANVIRY